MNQEMLDMITQGIIIPVVVALVPMIVALISASTNYIKERNQDKALNKYIDIAEDAVQTAVISVFQTFVSRIKGTEGWTPEVQKTVFEEAKRKAIAIMGITAREALHEVYDDFDAWLDNKIEYDVARINEVINVDFHFKKVMERTIQK